LIGEAEAPDGGIAADDGQRQMPVAAPAEPAQESAPDGHPGPESGIPPRTAGGDVEPVSVTMPVLGESITEGMVTRWLKNVGDHGEVDDALVEVSTDKVDTEIPSPAAGRLLAITAAADQVVRVGGELGKIVAAEAVSSETSRASEPAPQSQPERRSAPEPTSSPAAAPVERRAAPAETRPQDRGRQNSPSGGNAPLRGTVQKASRIRQLTAAKTRESLSGTAQLTQTHEIDMTAIVKLRARAKKAFAEREGVNLTFLPFIATAVIDALKAHPNINASYDEESKEITYHDAEHLGFAVDTAKGLLSPVVPNAGNLSLAGLARAIVDIAAWARSGDLALDELSGGTFTITNIGSEGALLDTPILVPPQAAILATGAIRKQPRVVVDSVGNESIGVRSVCYLSMTYDHRLVDGADAGRFLGTVRRRLEAADFVAELGLE
jgi:pyruvate dehydrogenase E2 component (dihydrolipoamide acetyltransferase)